MNLRNKFIIVLSVLFITNNLYAQSTEGIIKSKNKYSDTTSFNKNDKVKTREKKTGPNVFSFKKDTTPVKFHDPHISTIRSAIIPGWGQAYNRDYWKIPVVYGVLAIPAATWIYNNAWYKRTRDAYNIVVNEEIDKYGTIDYRLQPLITDPSTLQYYRNYFRKSRDYSVLYFLLAWGLNVSDATVFGHLKGFDVSDDLSLSVKPVIMPNINTTNLGFTISLENKSSAMLPTW